MRPYVTRRDVADTMFRVRRALGLLNWLAGREVPPEAKAAPLGVVAPGPWLEWLSTHGESVPGDLRPPAAGENAQAVFLAALSHPPLEDLNKAAATAHRRDLVLQAVSAIYYDIHPGRGSLPPASYGPISRIVDDRPTRESAGLWAFARWSTLVARSGRPLSHVDFLWRTDGRALAPRLTEHDVWQARRELRQALEHL